MSGDGYEPTHHQEQCPWCGKRAVDGDDGVGWAVLNGLWRPVHEGECTSGVNHWLKFGEHKPPFYAAEFGRNEHLDA